MKLNEVLLHGNRADQPDANDVAEASIYSVDDEDNIQEQAQGVAGARTWEPYSPTGGSATAIEGLTGDVTATGPGTVAATIAANAVSNAKFRQSGAISLVGRSANSAGNIADISAVAASDSVLRESGSAIGFGQIATAGIADAAVTTAKILDANVTKAKIENVAADSLLGRGNGGGAGAPQEITLGTGLSLAGTVLSASGAAINQLTGDVTAGPGSGSQAATIAANAVTTGKILDANVTLAKLVDASAASILLGRGAGGGSGDFQEITLGTGLSMASQVLSASGSGGNVTSSTAVGSEPGSPSSGDLDLYSNGPSIARYSGSIWAPWGPVNPLTRPSDTGFSWINQGSAALDTTRGLLVLSEAGSGTENVRMRVKTAPATPYVITTRLDILMFNKNYMRAGICFRQSSDGKIQTFGMIGTSASPPIAIITSSKWTSPTAFSADYVAITPVGLPRWWRIADDGSNRICSVSMDGYNWVVIHSVGRTDFLTANQVGFFIVPYNIGGGTFGVVNTVHSWLES